GQRRSAHHDTVEDGAGSLSRSARERTMHDVEPRREGSTDRRARVQRRCERFASAEESASLRDEGYQVRLIAVERRELGRAAQTPELREGLGLQRVPEFTIERILPALAPRWRHLIRHEAVAEPAAGPPAPGPLRPGAPLASTRARVLRGLRNVGERAYRTLALGTYWVNAARAGHDFAPDVVHANDANT